MTMDKGSVYGREFEFIRGKTIGIYGYPISASIKVHELTYDPDDPASGATGQALALNKEKAFNAVNLEKEEVGDVLASINCDGQYHSGAGGNHTVSIMQEMYQANGFVMDDPEPAHRVERMNEDVRNDNIAYQTAILSHRIIHNIQSRSDQKKNLLKQRLGKYYLTIKGFSETKFLAHLINAFLSQIRDTTGLIEIITADKGNLNEARSSCKSGRNNIFYFKILVCGELNFFKHFVIDALQMITNRLSKQSQSDLVPSYTLVEDTKDIQKHLNYVHEHMSRAYHHPRNLRHVLPLQVMRHFPHCNQYTFNDEKIHYAMHAHLESSFNKHATLEEKQRVIDDIGTHDFEYTIAHNTKTKYECHICHKTKKFNPNMVQCRLCKCYYHHIECEDDPQDKELDDYFVDPYYCLQNKCYENRDTPNWTPTITTTVYNQQEINSEIRRIRSNDTNNDSNHNHNHNRNVSPSNNVNEANYNNTDLNGELYTDDKEREISFSKETRDAWIMEMRLKCLGFISSLRQALKKRLVFSAQVHFMNACFNLKKHIDTIDSILETDGIEREKAEDDYFTYYAKDDMKSLVDIWNGSYKDERYNFLPDQVCGEYVDFKKLIFKLRERKIIDRVFEANKKQWKEHYGVKLSIHNELARLLLQNATIGRGLRSVLCIFGRCEVMGASEGKSEGEVFEASTRLRGRYRLRTLLFGKEHVINQLLRAFKGKKKEIIREAAVKLYNIPEFKENVIYAHDSRGRSANNKYPSTTLHRLLKKPVQADITEKELDGLLNDLD